MKIDYDDVCYNLQGMYEIVGENAFAQIARMYGGDVLYIPTYDSLIRTSRNRSIIKRYNGKNAGQLAREYGISTMHIRRIVSNSINSVH